MRFKVRLKKRKPLKPRQRIEMGPGWNFYRDGLSSSFILSWLDCREKAKLSFIDLLQRVTRGGSALRFGSFFHRCLELSQTFETAEEIVAFILAEWQQTEGKTASPEMWEAYELTAGKSYALLKHYLQFWTADHERKWLAVEQYFKVKFNGAYLVGLFDGVFENEKTGRVWLLETKTRARVDMDVTSDLLTFDLQTQLYLIALRQWLDSTPENRGKKIAGVLYNIVRKPGLKLKKNEGYNQFILRIDKDVESRPEHYFKRAENACGFSRARAWGDRILKPIVKEIERWSLHKSAHFLNPGSCQTKYGLCQYFPICARQDRSQFRLKERPYEHHPDPNKDEV